MPKVDSQFVANLKLAKTTPVRFAFVTKGPTECRLLLAKKPPVPPKEIAEAKKELGGGQVYLGRCRWENDQYVFELAKEPPGALAKEVRAVIARDAGLHLNVVCRVAQDLAGEEESSEPAKVQAPAPPSTQPTAPSEDATAKFIARLKALLPDLQKAEAANHPLSPEVKHRASEAQVLAREKEFDQANSLLDKIEAIVKQVLTAPPTSPAADEAARFTARLKAILPDLQKAEAANHDLSRELKLRASEARTAARAKDFVQANAVLDQVEKLVKQILAGAPGPHAQVPVGISLVKLGRARVEWIATRTRALGDMNRLKTAIQTEFENDPQQQAQLTAALARLDAIFAQMNEDLGNELDNVLNEKDTVRQGELAKVAKGTMKRFLEYVATDAIMAELDGNEVLPDVQIAGPVRVRLQEIAAALGQ